MSTLLRKMFEDFFGRQKCLLSVAEVPCALCRGEIYRGDHYYELDGQKVCESCLEHYARRYFAHRRRRLSEAGKEDT